MGYNGLGEDPLPQVVIVLGMKENDNSLRVDCGKQKRMIEVWWWIHNGGWIEDKRAVSSFLNSVPIWMSRGGLYLSLLEPKYTHWFSYK